MGTKKRALPSPSVSCHPKPTCGKIPVFQQTQRWELPFRFYCPLACVHSSGWLEGRSRECPGTLSLCIQNMASRQTPGFHPCSLLWDPLKKRLGSRWQNRNKGFLYMNCLLGYWDYLASVSRTGYVCDLGRSPWGWSPLGRFRWIIPPANIYQGITFLFLHTPPLC